jgi:hypothetical protein
MLSEPTFKESDILLNEEAQRHSGLGKIKAFAPLGRYAFEPLSVKMSISPQWQVIC